MKELKIEIPAGFEIDTFDAKAGVIKLKEKPKSVFDRIKTVDDILADHKILRGQFYDDDCAGLADDEVAYRILKLLAKSLNEGWKPNWDNDSEGKFYPWFYLDGGSSGFRFGGCDRWYSRSGVGSRLCFKSRELAEYAGKQFTDVYKRFMVIQ